MQAPVLELDGTDGRRPLRPQQGKYLLLLFYQEDGTPTCTTELTSFREEADLLVELGLEVVGVSTDDLASHRHFIEWLGQLPFPLLSDPGGVAARAFGAWDESAGRALRAVFVIDADGGVVHSVCPYNPTDLTAFEGIFRAVGFEG